MEKRNTFLPAFVWNIFLPKHFQRMGCPKICLLQATGEEDDHRGHQRHHLHHRQHHCHHQLRGHCVEDHLRTSVNRGGQYVEKYITLSFSRIFEYPSKHFILKLKYYPPPLANPGDLPDPRGRRCLFQPFNRSL